MDNFQTLFIIILICAFFLIRLSVLFNILTLGIVGGIILLTYTVYTRRQDRAVTPQDVGKDLITDPLVVGRAYFSEVETGPIGDFTGQSSWSDDQGLRDISPDEEA
jgi:hypothetical protein